MFFFILFFGVFFFYLFFFFLSLPLLVIAQCFVDYRLILFVCIQANSDSPDTVYCLILYNFSFSFQFSECIRHTALVESKVYSLATCRSVRRRKGSKMGVLTQEPRGCPHPGAERVSSPGSREDVLTRVSRGCPHPSPRAASLTYLGVSRTKVTWRHQTNKWWSSTSP